MNNFQFDEPEYKENDSDSDDEITQQKQSRSTSQPKASPTTKATDPFELPSNPTKNFDPFGDNNFGFNSTSTTHSFGDPFDLKPSFNPPTTENTGRTNPTFDPFRQEPTPPPKTIAYDERKKQIEMVMTQPQTFTMSNTPLVPSPTVVPNPNPINPNNRNPWATTTPFNPAQNNPMVFSPIPPGALPNNQSTSNNPFFQSQSNTNNPFGF